MCDRWKDSFENFLEDMGLCPEGMSIDRIDNDGNYTSENCQWATRQEQSVNKRSNIRVVVGGREGVLSEIADFFEIVRATLYYQVKMHGPKAVMDCLRKHYVGDFDSRLNDWLGVGLLTGGE